MVHLWHLPHIMHDLRLRAVGLMSPPFEKLEAHVEGMWREILGDDLSLYDLKPVRAEHLWPCAQVLDGFCSLLPTSDGCRHIVDGLGI